MSTQSRSPFVLRTGQLMTGFGAGCGIGIGVGYPIALGSIPVLGDALNATSSAGSRAFGGVGRHAFGLLRKVGVKNLQAGFGCGVGFGHGFGVGLGLKPGVSQQMFLFLQERVLAVTSGLQKHLPSVDEEVPGPSQTLQHIDRMPGVIPGKAMDVMQNDVTSSTVQTEADSTRSNVTVPKLNTEPATSTSKRGDEEVHLRQENEILRTLLRHRELIEDLKAENAALWLALSEGHDIMRMDPEPNRGASMVRRMVKSGRRTGNFQSKCFDCRLSARRRRYMGQRDSCSPRRGLL